MKRLSQFEKLAQRLVEGSFSRLLGGRLELVEVATQIAHALEDNWENGRIADYYEVHLHPTDYDSIVRENPDLSQTLSDYVMQLAQKAGLTLDRPPRITLLPDDNLRRQQVAVALGNGPRPEGEDAGEAEPSQGNTQIFQSEATQGGRLAMIRAVDAYLIIDGKRHVPLEQPVTTIGRRVDNDIVLEGAAVSRQHAQIRWRYGRFVIYDLGSRAGTTVNGQPVVESALHPGDLIYLSDVPLIYGEGVAGRETPPRSADSSGSDVTRPYDL